MWLFALIELNNQAIRVLWNNINTLDLIYPKQEISNAILFSEWSAGLSQLKKVTKLYLFTFYCFSIFAPQTYNFAVLYLSISSVIQYNWNANVSS